MKTFGDDGGYKVDSGMADDMGQKPQGSLRLNTSSIKGAENYRSGDDINLTIKAKMGEVGSDGMADMQIVRVQADDMDYGAKVARAREPQGVSEGGIL